MFSKMVFDPSLLDLTFHWNQLHPSLLAEKMPSIKVKPIHVIEVSEVPNDQEQGDVQNATQGRELIKII